MSSPPVEQQAARDDVDEIELALLLEGVYRRYGFDFREYAPASLRRRVWRRVHAEGLTTISALQERLLHDPACMERLLERGNYPGIATHDVKIIDRAKAFTKQNGISAERFEFQMLYGVRRDLQYRLRREGYNMRVYVPFGTHWYPYLMRRLAERPANIAFITANILKEWTTRR